MDGQFSVDLSPPLNNKVKVNHEKQSESIEMVYIFGHRGVYYILLIYRLGKRKKR